MGKQGEYMNDQTLKEADICPVDFYVKSTVIKDAIVLGQAPDTGLFVPERFPQITLDEIGFLV